MLHFMVTLFNIYIVVLSTLSTYHNINKLMFSVPASLTPSAVMALVTF